MPARSGAEKSLEIVKSDVGARAARRDVREKEGHDLAWDQYV